MNLYLKIENNQAVGHPFLEENLLHVHGQIPSNFAPFKRRTPEECGLFAGDYQKYVSTYILSDDGVTWQDNWSLEDMNADEIAVRMAKIEEEKKISRANLLILQSQMNLTQNNISSTSNTA
jgi:hypothetical protein